MTLLRRTGGHVLLLLIAALLPRIFTLGRAFTTDEAYHWQHRAPAFLSATLEGRFADTILTGHPGVTTMWLGAIGLLVEGGLQRLGLLAAGVPFETHLTFLRLPLTLATVAAVLAGYTLLRGLLGPTVAFLAGLLWATDPFLVGHSRVLHLDALLSFLTLLSTLALLAACFTEEGPRERPRTSLLVLAGVFTGLALVTKAPGVLVLPIGGMVLLLWAWMSDRGRRTDDRGQQGERKELAGRGPEAAYPPLSIVHHRSSVIGLRSVIPMVSAGALWLLTALAVAFVSWPALWVVPGEAVGRVVSEVIDNGGRPMHWGNFLLGQSEKDPGALYYLVTLAGRTTPWTALGLLALLVGLVGHYRWIRTNSTGRSAVSPTPARLRPLFDTLQQGRWLVLLLLFLAMLLIVAAMSITAKKADRYALPAVPLLLVLAAAGLSWLGALLPSLLRRIGVGTIVVAAAATLCWLHPYYLAYFGPLVGGSAGAPKIVPIGWGEGLDVVADWLNQQPDVTAGRVATWSPPTLKPYLKTDTTWQGGVNDGGVNYLVVYIAQAQSGKEGQYFGRYYPGCTPLHVVQVRNIDYAWIYRVSQQRNDELNATFGDAVQLGGYTILMPDSCTSPGRVRLTLTLLPQGQPSEQHFLFLQVLDESDGKVAQQELPLQQIIPAAAWQSGAAVPYTIDLPFPADAPPGSYRLIAGVFDLASGQRLPITAAPSPPKEQIGPDMLELGRWRVDGGR